ncbi:type IV secretion system DotC family protein [Agrobacterium rubi]|nr:type IV secretion system DotC family protein [Agrobacterium rubi]NTF23633.1 type IV secretion system DotC family protein [Agrobacterium rubi]
MKISLLAAVSALSIVVSGCTTTSSVSPQPDAVRTAQEATLRADVNPGKSASSPEIPTKETASLEQILAKTSKAPKQEEPKKGEDRLRLPAMQEAATAYGAQAGLAFGTRSINKTLQARAAELSKTYDFTRVMIQGPNNVMVVPPVISEAQDAWEVSDAGQTVRIADKVFEIVENEEFTAVTPIWQSYLIMDFKEAEMPPAMLLPKTDSETAQWKSWVAEGFKKGEEQSEATLQANLDRLNRDFTGMVRYKKLVEENLVNKPQLAAADMGTTGTGQDMRQNDRAVKIMQPASLNVQSREWTASATTTDASGNKAGAEKPVEEPKKAERPKSSKPTQKRTSQPRKPAASAKPVDEPTKGGSNRF